MMTERIQKTLDFLNAHFANAQDGYRLEHSIRVAHIGAEIARAEGFDQEAFIIACLLHDIAYSIPHTEDYNWLDHGRDGAKLVRPFLYELGLPEETVGQICYAIAIHVDDQADFDGEDTPFANSISDADNIDRFDTLRLYFNLHNNAFHDKPLAEKLSWTEKYLSALERLRNWGFATTTAKTMWLDKINLQIDFHSRLLNQLKNSTTPEEF